MKVSCVVCDARHLQVLIHGDAAVRVEVLGTIAHLAIHYIHFGKLVIGRGDAICRRDHSLLFLLPLPDLFCKGTFIHVCISDFYSGSFSNCIRHFNILLVFRALRHDCDRISALPLGSTLLAHESHADADD